MHFLALPTTVLILGLFVVMTLTPLLEDVLLRQPPAPKPPAKKSEV